MIMKMRARDEILLSNAGMREGMEQLLYLLMLWKN
jgi:hypothetical protein